MKECSDAMGLLEGATRKRLIPLIQAGHVVCVKVKRTNLHGVTSTLPGYRFTQ